MKYPSTILIINSSHPTTAGLPIARATTAAWEVIPPLAVRIPWAAFIPWISSGVVSGRTRRTFSPCSASSTASSGSKTTLPTAAPGLAARPLAITFFSALGSICGCRSVSIFSGVTRITASSFEIKPSSTISTAMRTAAAAVLLPFLVCRRYSLPFSMVNSISCISL